MPPATDYNKAALAMNLGDAGASSTQVAAQVGISQRAAWDIINRQGRWGEVAERSVFAKLRSEQNQVLEAVARSMAIDSWTDAYAKKDKASYYQLVVGGSILLDKARLLAGEPTQIIENTINPATVSALEKLASVIELAKRERQARDITEIQTQFDSQKISDIPSTPASQLSK